jgi:hypothetical protein
VDDASRRKDRTDAFGQRTVDFYDYFQFDKTGAILVDFRSIQLAAKSVLPAGAPFPQAKDLAVRFQLSRYVP